MRNVVIICAMLFAMLLAIASSAQSKNPYYSRTDSKVLLVANSEW